MSREEFMERLAYLLSDVTEEEREDAILYYEDYFDEAGVENEQKVIQELGSPERVAAIIRNGMDGTTEGGSFTERGFEDERFRDPNTQLARRLDLPEVAEKEKKEEDHVKGNQSAYEDRKGKKENNSGLRGNRRLGNRWIKVVLFLVLLSLVWGLIEDLFGIGMGMIGSILSILFLPAAIALVSLILMVVFLSIAVMNVATPWALMFFAGMAILFLGICVLAIAFSITFYGSWLPALAKKICQTARNLRDRAVKGKET